MRGGAEIGGVSGGPGTLPARGRGLLRKGASQGRGAKDGSPISGRGSQLALGKGHRGSAMGVQFNWDDDWVYSHFYLYDSAGFFVLGLGEELEFWQVLLSLTSN